MQPLREKSTLIFEPDVNPSCSDRFEFSESVVLLKRAAPTKVTVEVCNHTEHDITLRDQTPIGTVPLVKSVFPAGPFEVPASSTTAGVHHIQAIEQCHENINNDVWEPPVNVSPLSEIQRQVVQQMLRE